MAGHDQQHGCLPEMRLSPLNLMQSPERNYRSIPQQMKLRDILNKHSEL
jgi:hypothetical protein